MISKELFKNINEICNETELVKEDIYEIIKKSLVYAYKKAFGDDSCKVVLNPEKQELCNKRDLQHAAVSGDDGLFCNDAPLCTECYGILCRSLRSGHTAGLPGHCGDQSSGRKDVR